MPLRVEAYAVDAIARGQVDWPGRFRDGLEAAVDLPVHDATLVPLDDPRPQSVGSITIGIDDLVIGVADDDPAAPVHAAWHRIRLECGPYVVEGELSTMPGFDPGRALTRPTGTFVLLRDVVVRLLGRPEAGESPHDHALVNRYAVDSVEADIMLGFFFPGARIIGDPAAPGALPPPGLESGHAAAR